jgi:cytochrome c556
MMTRLVSVGCGLVLLAVLSLLVGPVPAKDPTIKEIMNKAHKGGNSILTSVGNELRGSDPDWDDVQNQTKDLVKLGTALGKNNPPAGEKESWQRLTAEYLTNAKALDAAAQKKDKAGAQAAYKKLTTSCKTCHQAHRAR